MGGGAWVGVLARVCTSPQSQKPSSVYTHAHTTACYQRTPLQCFHSREMVMGEGGGVNDQGRAGAQEVDAKYGHHLQGAQHPGGHLCVYVCMCVRMCVCSLKLVHADPLSTTPIYAWKHPSTHTYLHIQPSTHTQTHTHT